MAGNIKQRPDGRWRARYRDESGKEHSRHFRRKSDGVKWLDEVTASVVTGRYADPHLGRATFNEFYIEWSTRQLWQSTTRAAMDLAVGSVSFGELPLSRVRTSHVEQWVKAMTVAGTKGKPLASSTIKTRFTNVRSVFRAAVRDHVIALDPTEGVRLPRLRRRSQTMVVPTPEEVRRLVQSAGPGFDMFISLCAYAGLRLGEAAAVQVGDIDFLKRTLHVRRQVQRAAGRTVEFRLPKHGSERTIPLPAALVDQLSAHVSRHCGGAREDWLFLGGRAGQPPHQNTVGHRWRSTLDAAGLGLMKLHDLRHFYASGLISQGCDVVTVQGALGHQSAKTTLDTYAHLWKDGTDRIRAASEHLMLEGLGSDGLGLPAT